MYQGSAETSADPSQEEASGRNKKINKLIN